MNEYDRQARDFCNKTGLKITKTYQGHYKRWDDQKYVTAVWRVVLDTSRGSHAIEYSDNANNSYKKRDSGCTFHRPLTSKEWNYTAVQAFAKIAQHGWLQLGCISVCQSHPEPSDYGILACLQKSDIGTFEEFCSDFGYDTDSRKAEKTYFAVQNEFAGLRRIFTEDHLIEMSAIQ